MPEGPSLIIAKENIASFTGKKVIACSGSSPIDYDRVSGQKIKSIQTWGKHLLIVFPDFTIRVHFLMFGTYLINDSKNLKPRLSLQFARNQELNFYTCAVKWIEGDVSDAYDWSVDVMGDQWSPAKALKKLSKTPIMVCDALMDQQLFSGVGNIIKNEVLWRVRVHPESVVASMSLAKKKELIKEARNYSFQFLEWKKENTLKKHWMIYSKKTCPRCNIRIIKKMTGVSNRRSFFCKNCQRKNS